MKTLNEVLSELNKFDKSLYGFYEGAGLDLISKFEKKINYDLPIDFKEFLVFSNGANILFETIMGVDTRELQFDLYSTYLLERDESGNPIPGYLLPISPNGRGDHYCLDLTSLSDNKETCKVVFWQHDYNDINTIPVVAAISFYDFLFEIITDFLKYNNYDGTEIK